MELPNTKLATLFMTLPIELALVVVHRLRR